MIDFLKKYNPYFVLLLVVISAYWQISFLAYALKWDLIDVVFPFRFYFSESIQSGYFPFWNPYQQTGTPFFADLQAPTFYPELLFTSLFTGYGVYTMHFLFVVYAFIAGVGLFKLSYFFNNNKWAALIAGIAYSLSGFVIGHGQHFFLLIGAAWIPFVILYYLKLNENRTFINVLKTAIFVFLMVSGAYQALSFTLFYLLLLLFIFFVSKEIVQKNWKGVGEILKVNIFLLLVIVAFALPLIVSTLEILTSVDRLEEGISLNETLRFGQTFKSIISCVLPFSTLKYNEFFGGADVSMRNHYFGLIPLLFFAAALFQKRSKLEYLILIFGVLIFASSFDFLPVRTFMFRFVPFMNLFKYAAFIRIFGLLAFILLAANYFAYFQKNSDKEKKKVLALGFLLLSALVFLIIYSISKITGEEFKALFGNNSFSETLKNMSFYQHVLIQAIFQFCIGFVFLLVVFFYKRLRNPIYLILIIFFIEVFAAAQLNMSFTVVDSLHKPARMKKDLALYPENFPIPVNDKIIFNDQRHVSFQPFYRNTYNFSKQVSFNAFSSFELNTYSKLDDEFPNLRDAVLNNHLFYFSDSIFSLEQFNDSKIQAKKDSKHIYFSEKDFTNLSNKVIATNIGDNIDIIEFSPNKVGIETNTKNDQFLTFLQTNFKGWKAYIDNIETPIYTSNFNYRTIFLPKGKHTICYEYRNTKIVVLYIFSNLFFVLIVLFLIASEIRKRNVAGKSFIAIPLGILLLISFFLVKRIAYKDNNLKVNQIYNERWAEKDALFHYQQDFEHEVQKNETIKVLSETNSFKISSDAEYFNLITIENKREKLQNGTLVVRAKIFPKTYVEALIVSTIPGENPSNPYHAAKIEKQIEHLNQWNEIMYYRNFYDLEENEEIKIYLWNLKKSNFRIDNITVDFYK